jgi:hypothetical protein
MTRSEQPATAGTPSFPTFSLSRPRRHARPHRIRPERANWHGHNRPATRRDPATVLAWQDHPLPYKASERAAYSLSSTPPRAHQAIVSTEHGGRRPVSSAKPEASSVVPATRPDRAQAAARSMAASNSSALLPVLALAGVVFLLVAPAVVAEAAAPQGLEFHVGGPRGWRVPDANTSYGWWTMKNRFRVGDHLCELFSNSPS